MKVNPEIVNQAATLYEGRDWLEPARAIFIG